MKTFWRITFFGGLLGGILATWVAPKAIAWYFDPPVNFGVSCKAPIEWALKRLQWAQLIGFLIGVAVAIFFYFLFNRRKSEPVQPM